VVFSAELRRFAPAANCFAVPHVMAIVSHGNGAGFKAATAFPLWGGGRP
jgi:hypothetical protein